VTRRRLILFLFLNILVSALVTGSILFLYDRFGRPECASGIGAASGISITNVSSVSDGNAEIITLENTGDEAVVLTGWVLQDGEGTAYTFPQLTIYPGGSIKLHTGNGEDSATDLFWDLSASTWESGELAVLYDTQGLARAFYRIP
jgi:hypothetical protein